MNPFVETVRSYRQGASTLPGQYYTSPEIFAQECERIFRRHWLCVGREAQIVTPGAYFVASVAGESVIVLRDEQHVARAFYNICRHRGTRLCEEQSGELSRSIQCPYHAWTYTLDGRLLGAPHMEGVEDFEKREYSLHRVPLEIWEGFLFLNLSPQPRSLAEAFTPLADRFRRFRLPRLRPSRRIGYVVEANWKLLFQNYSECLHCPVIHPGLARRSPWRSGENDLAEGPFLGGFMLLDGDSESLTVSGRACGPVVGELPHEDLRRVYYYSIFPNLLVSLHPDYVMFHMLQPESATRTRVECEWLFHPDALHDPQYDPEDAVSFWDATNREDWHICELSQKGISSRMYAPGPYSPRESLPAAWDREYARQLGQHAEDVG
ncbi:MAG: aromatic ring-hydroxylating dioxygenase subunit alpha [Gemmatimonadetes bacterium]|nr:aromatic ring-hydroxylating dioxygenase subunit alpha [Gemmatimonadota bacterium]